VADRVRDMMSTHVVCCAADTPLREVARRMRDEDIGDVVVTDGDQLRGIVTDRDIVVRCLAEHANLSKATIADCISPDVVTVTPDASTKDAARMMAARSIRRLPVVEGGRPIGIVSLGDLAMGRDPESALAGISAAPANH
jgi:CBS domain-containing protein